MVWLKKIWILINSGLIFCGSCSPQHSDPSIPRVALCISPTQRPSRRKHPGDDNVPASLPSLPNPIASQTLLPARKSAGRKGGMRGGSFAESYLGPRTGALPAGAQGKPSSRNDLSGAASLLCSLLGKVIYPARPGVPARSSLRRHLREPPAAPREGGVALCVGIFAFGASPLPPATLRAPEALPPPPSLLPLGKVLTGVEKAPNSSEQGRPYAFLPSH